MNYTFRTGSGHQHLVLNDTDARTACGRAAVRRADLISAQDSYDLVMLLSCGDCLTRAQKRGLIHY